MHLGPCTTPGAHVPGGCPRPACKEAAPVSNWWLNYKLCASWVQTATGTGTVRTAARPTPTRWNPASPAATRPGAATPLCQPLCPPPHPSVLQPPHPPPRPPLCAHMCPPLCPPLNRHVGPRLCPPPRPLRSPVCMAAMSGGTTCHHLSPQQLLLFLLEVPSIDSFFVSACSS